MINLTAFSSEAADRGLFYLMACSLFWLVYWIRFRESRSRMGQRNVRDEVRDQNKDRRYRQILIREDITNR